MNAERLLQLYGRVSEAPDAIPRLRKFILDLAVRGKLVEQDPEDELASDLLSRINVERGGLVASKTIKGSSVDLIAPNVIPFELPASWCWTRLGAIGDWGSGSTPSRGNAEFYGGGISWLKSGELNDNMQLAGSEEKVTEKAVERGSFRINRPGDVLIAMYGATIGKLAILAETAVTNQAVCGCTPFGGVFNHFLFLFLLSQREALRRASEGGAQPNISKVKIINTLFPLPPIAEQHRIVAKVGELMALCDSLQAEREKREATRDRLTTASLSRLTAPDVDEKQFKAHADFAIKVLPELTTRPDQIKVLRQTILDLAVRGKLVEQEPNDEPASDLLNSIAVRISDLVSKGELKKPQSVSPLPASMDCVGLPLGWALARFGDIASIETNLVDPKAHKSMPHIAPDNIEGWTGRLLPYISVAKSGVFSGKHLFDPGVLLYSKIRPNLAKVTKVDFRGLCSADMYPILPFISRDYLLIFMITQAFVDQAVTEANRVAMPKINQAALSNIIVSVPPLAEQGRIVAKANELLAKCGELERELSFGRATTSRLLHALLIAALRPVALEAA